MELLIIFVIGFVSSFFGSFTSGGTSLLSLALLGAYGLPTLMSLGIYKVGNVGFQLGGLFNYVKADKVIWKYVVPLVCIGAVGAFIGGKIVLSVDEQLLSRVIGLALLLFVPLSFFKPKLGIVEITVSNTHKRLGYVAYFLTSVWGVEFHYWCWTIQYDESDVFFWYDITSSKGNCKNTRIN